jgi:micrococcal nuclease
MKLRTSLSILFAVSLCFAAETWVKGIAHGIIDGDTFNMKIDGQIIKIRVYGIEAPEKKQPYGKEAGEALRNLIDGKEIRLRMIGDTTFGRPVGEPWLGDSLNVSLWMVKNGHSWWWPKKYSKKDIKLKEAEEEARVKKLGLWASDDAVAPWDFKAKEKKTGKRKGKRAGKM